MERENSKKGKIRAKWAWIFGAHARYNQRLRGHRRSKRQLKSLADMESSMQEILFL